MKYIKSSLLYMKKKFFSLFMYAALPALFLAIATNPVNVFETFFKFSEFMKKDKTLLKILQSMTEISWRGLAFLIVNIILISVFLSVLGGIIEKHMRLGQFTHSNFLKNLNMNIIPIMLMMLALLALIECYGLIASLFMFFWIVVIKHYVAALVMSIITTLLLLFGLFVLFSYFILVPSMAIIQGFKLTDSVRGSTNLIKGSLIDILVALILPIIPFEIILTEIKVLIKNNALNISLSILFNFVFYAFIFVYYLVLSFVIYFDLNCIDRDDIKPKWGATN